jgi:5-methylcytosine-specific restriction endonuclease McrA
LPCEKAAKLGSVLTSLQALLRLAVLQRLGVFICALATLLAAANTASALEPAQTKTRVWGFDFAADNSSGLFLAATSGKHQGNCFARAEEASGSLLAVRGAAGGERAGKPFTRAGKAEVKADNAAAHGGQTTCTNCGQATVPGQQSRAGVTPPKNETHVDHIIPKSQQGNGSPNNGQVLCRDCNLRKGAD